jgi:hypothetical protein
MPCVSSAANWPAGQLFPPEQFSIKLEALLDEILEERCVSSRGRRIPRGVKRKMSGYAVRRGNASSDPITFSVKICCSPK